MSRPSMPSSKRANCTAVIDTLPSFAAGQKPMPVILRFATLPLAHRMGAAETDRAMKRILPTRCEP